MMLGCIYCIVYPNVYPEYTYRICMYNVLRFVRAQLAQWLEHQTFNLRVAGSNPILGVFLF